MNNIIALCRASAECVKAIGSAPQVGPTSLDIPDWIQAISSVTAIAAVAAVAFVEHRRAVRAESVTAEAERRQQSLVAGACQTIAIKTLEEWLSILSQMQCDDPQPGLFVILGNRIGQPAIARAVHTLEQIVARQNLNLETLLVATNLIEALQKIEVPTEAALNDSQLAKTQAAILQDSLRILNKSYLHAFDLYYWLSIRWNKPLQLKTESEREVIFLEMLKLAIAETNRERRSLREGNAYSTMSDA